MIPYPCCGPWASAVRIKNVVSCIASLLMRSLYTVALTINRRTSQTRPWGQTGDSGRRGARPGSRPGDLAVREDLAGQAEVTVLCQSRFRSSDKCQVSHDPRGA